MLALLSLGLGFGGTRLAQHVVERALAHLVGPDVVDLVGAAVEALGDREGGVFDQEAGLDGVLAGAREQLVQSLLALSRKAGGRCSS